MALTILCAGTAFDRSNTDELFGALARSVRSAMIFNPGPGSAEELHRRRSERVRSRRGMPEAAAGADDIAWLVDLVGGLAAGDGVLQAISRTIGQLDRMRPRPTDINIAGWSRGAVCAIGLANAMLHHPNLRNVRLTMFLVDPVPGPGVANGALWTENFTTVGQNVKHCCVLLMMHEAGYIFPPILRPFRHDGPLGHTYFEVYPLPGHHGSAVKIEPPFEAVRDIGWYLCHSFLEAHGTVIENRFYLNGQQLSECYASAKLVSDATPTPLYRSIPSQREGLQQRYYLTLDHRDAFLEAWPAVYDVISHARSTRKAADDLRFIRSAFPSTWRVLSSAGGVNLGDFMKANGIT